MDRSPGAPWWIAFLRPAAHLLVTKKYRCDNLGGMRLSGRKPSSYTRSWTQRQRVVLLALVAGNVAAFVVQYFLEAYEPGFVRDFLGLSKVGVENAHAWQFLTAAFLHTGPWQLIANTVVLYLLGRDVECILGQQHFLGLYLAGAFAGELGHLFLMPPTTVLYAGAGGTAAVLVAYATVLPELELTSFRFFRRQWTLKAAHFAGVLVVCSVALLFLRRDGTVMHSVCLGGCAAGWFYAHLLGFGRPSFIRRALNRRRAKAERLAQMEPGQFIVEEVDPLLEKIARHGLPSLSRRERRTLEMAREKLGGATPTVR